MQNFNYSEPFLYPDLENSDKDTKGNPINSKGQPIKKWFVRYKITYADGTTKYPKEYGKSYKIELNKIKNIVDKEFKAKVLLAYVKDDLKNGIDPEEREKAKEKQIAEARDAAKRYAFKYVFELWFEAQNYNNPIPSKKISAKNLKAFHLNQFLPFLVEKGIDTDIRLITDDIINEFIQQKFNSGEWSAFTAGDRVGWFSGLFNFAFQKKIIANNPMLYVQKIKEDKIIVKDGVSTLKKKKENRFNIFTDVELERVFEVVKNTKDEAVFKTLHFAFIRFSEIFRLKVAHLDLINNQFIIPAVLAKGQRDGETAYVPIFPELKECLTRYLKNQFKDDLNPDYPLFPLDINIASEDTYNNLYTRFRTVIKNIRESKNSINIIGKTPYALKHTGAQRFIKENKALNVSAYEIMDALKDLMRHKDFATTQKYMKKDLGISLDSLSKFTFGKTY